MATGRAWWTPRIRSGHLAGAQPRSEASTVEIGVDTRGLQSSGHDGAAAGARPAGRQGSGRQGLRLWPRRDQEQLECELPMPPTRPEGSGRSCHGRRRRPLPPNGASPLQKHPLPQVWKARASKEAKGRDPWEAFSSTNTDVRPAGCRCSSRCCCCCCRRRRRCRSHCCVPVQPDQPAAACSIQAPVAHYRRGLSSAAALLFLSKQAEHPHHAGLQWAGCGGAAGLWS